MSYRLAADLVLAVHAAFVAFVVMGGLLALRWPRAVWLHLPALAWGTLIEASGRVCPLTPLENRLRRLGGEAGYAGGFVEHYVMPVLYPAALTRAHQLVLAALLVGFNVAVYALLVRRAVAARCARAG